MRIPQHPVRHVPTARTSGCASVATRSVQSQDDNELHSNLVESERNVRQLEGEFVDSVHVDKSEGVQGRIVKSKMWWFENSNMSLTVIEVLSNGYIEALFCANSRFVFHSYYIIVHYATMNLSRELSILL